MSSIEILVNNTLLISAAYELVKNKLNTYKVIQENLVNADILAIG